jgi:hypothetical protein
MQLWCASARPAARCPVQYTRAFCVVHMHTVTRAAHVVTRLRPSRSPCPPHRLCSTAQRSGAISRCSGPSGCAPPSASMASSAAPDSSLVVTSRISRRRRPIHNAHRPRVSHSANALTCAPRTPSATRCTWQRSPASRADRLVEEDSFGCRAHSWRLPGMRSPVSARLRRGHRPHRCLHLPPRGGHDAEAAMRALRRADALHQPQLRGGKEGHGHQLRPRRRRQDALDDGVHPHDVPVFGPCVVRGASCQTAFRPTPGCRGICLTASQPAGGPCVQKAFVQAAA